jgi:altered-inheritance-of-mitochondria protein 13
MAIEKENLARESKYQGQSEGKNSNVLRQELDELRRKIDKYNKNRDVTSYTGVKEAQDALVKCYK